jgi:hypothetical protein
MRPVTEEDAALLHDFAEKLFSENHLVSKDGSRNQNINYLILIFNFKARFLVVKIDGGYDTCSYNCAGAISPSPNDLCDQVC